MPKIRTNRGAAKRFSITANGKVKMKRAFKSHILTKKSTKRKRALRATGYVSDTQAAQIKRLIPYK